jgi:hypothetical protein
MREEANRDALRRWLATVRSLHARDAAAFSDQLPLSPEESAALLLAIDIGIGLQYLVDPEAVPAATYGRGVEAVLGGVRRAGGSAPR